MQPHQERVVKERAELDEKISKLSKFIGTDTFQALPLSEQTLLREQRDVMNRYSSILGERIAAFPTS